MPSPRKRRVKSRLIAAKVIEPAGLTQVAAGDETDATKNYNLVQTALYSNYGVSASLDISNSSSVNYGSTVINYSTTHLTDVISNTDGNFSNAGRWPGYPGTTGPAFQTGETTDITGSATPVSNYLVHFGLPRLREAQTDASSSFNFAYGQSAIIYTADGPRSDYVNYYWTGTLDDATTDQNAGTGTGSIKFNSTITGSALGIGGNVPGSTAASTNYDYLQIYVAGTLQSASGGTIGDAGAAAGDMDRIIISSSEGYAYFNGSGSFTTGTYSITTSSLLQTGVAGFASNGLEIFWSSSLDTDSTQ